MLLTVPSFSPGVAVVLNDLVSLHVHLPVDLEALLVTLGFRDACLVRGALVHLSWGAHVLGASLDARGFLARGRLGLQQRIARLCGAGGDTWLVVFAGLIALHGWKWSVSGVR